jgi:low temperature requirement protein LtrA
VIVAAALGIAVVSALWWLYFDVAAIIARQRLMRARGVDLHRLALHSYSYFHLAMVAGIVLFALGLKTTLGHPEGTLHVVPAFALLGGVAVYLLGLVAFRYRHVHTVNRHRLALALVLFALIPVALELPPLAILGVMNLLIWAMITYETISYGESRARVRHEPFAPPAQ